MDCTVIVLAGGQGLRMGGLGQLSAKTALVIYDWPLLIRALHQMVEHGFSQVIVSTNATFYPQLNALIDSYRAALKDKVAFEKLDVIENAAHDDGPLPALLQVLKMAATSRCLLYLADEFLLSNPFGDFAAAVSDEADYLGVAYPVDARELYRGGLVYCNGAEVEEVVEKPQQSPGSDGLRWSGVALFNRQQLCDDLEQYLTQAPKLMPVGEIFEYRRTLGHPVRAIHGPDFINVNSPDHMLLASLYVAMGVHQDNHALCAALGQAAASLRSTL